MPLIPQDEDALARAISAERASEDQTKRCPACAENIQAAAIVCKHCGKKLSDPNLRNPILVIGGAFLVLFIVYWLTHAKLF